MKVHKRTEEEIDRSVIEGASDDDAWEKSIQVHKPKSDEVLSDSDSSINTAQKDD